MSSDAVSRTGAGNRDEELIPRYTFGERANHWIGALAYIYCMITGLAFWSPYLYWLAATVGGGPTARFWHPWFGVIFALSFLRTTWEWRGDMKVNDADRAWGKAIPNYIQNQDEKLPATGRFNYGQKIFFWGMLYSIILLVLSGVVLWLTQAVAWDMRFLRFAAILIHSSVALITIGLFLIHVYMSAIMEEGSFGSMVQGKVTRAWAWTFHRTWYDQVKGGPSSNR
jgi:formate dehydrogenase subunit gamma